MVVWPFLVCVPISHYEAIEIEGGRNWIPGVVFLETNGLMLPFVHRWIIIHLVSTRLLNAFEVSNDLRKRILQYSCHESDCRLTLR